MKIDPSRQTEFVKSFIVRYGNEAYSIISRIHERILTDKDFQWSEEDKEELGIRSPFDLLAKIYFGVMHFNATLISGIHEERESYPNELNAKAIEKEKILSKKITRFIQSFNRIPSNSSPGLGAQAFHTLFLLEPYWGYYADRNNKEEVEWNEVDPSDEEKISKLKKAGITILKYTKVVPTHYKGMPLLEYVVGYYGYEFADFYNEVTEPE